MRPLWLRCALTLGSVEYVEPFQGACEEALMNERPHIKMAHGGSLLGSFD